MQDLALCLRGTLYAKLLSAGPRRSLFAYKSKCMTPALRSRLLLLSPWTIPRARKCALCTSSPQHCSLRVRAIKCNLRDAPLLFLRRVAREERERRRACDCARKAKFLINRSGKHPFPFRAHPFGHEAQFISARLVPLPRAQGLGAPSRCINIRPFEMEKRTGARHMTRDHGLFHG